MPVRKVDSYQFPGSLVDAGSGVVPIVHLRNDEAAKLADAIEMLDVDPSIPDDPFAGRPASDGDAAEGERLYTREQRYS